MKSHCFTGSGLVTVTLPETVQEVEDDAFVGCRNLVKVVIDNPYIHMKNIFMFCLSLSEIIFHGTMDQAKQVFEDIYIPKNVLIKCIDGGIQI